MLTGADEYADRHDYDRFDHDDDLPPPPGKRRILKRIFLTLVVLFCICGTAFGALWWRLGAGPIEFSMATPWLIEAIQSNFGEGKTVEVGGTRIERTGRFRIAIRIRDIVVLDRDHAVVASAPKAEVRLSGKAMLMGQLQAESLNLVDAVLSVRISPEGEVTVATGRNARPVPTGITRHVRATPEQVTTTPVTPGVPNTDATAPSLSTVVPPPAARDGETGLAIALEWLDGLGKSGLDGQHLAQIGLKNGSLIVDDQQRGQRLSFDNVTMTLRRASSGGVTLSLGEGDAKPWNLDVSVGPAVHGTRSFDISATAVPFSNFLLAMRAKELNYSADFLFSGEIKGELGPDGLPNYLRGKLATGAGRITDEETPDYPMKFDQAEINLEWDPQRKALLAPFKVASGDNRVTLLALLEAPGARGPFWKLGLTGGTIVLGGTEKEAPLVFNHIAVNVIFDTDSKRISFPQADINNGQIGVAGSGFIDYSGEPRLALGFAGTPLNASALKRMWPILIAPEVREWVLERILAGQLQKVDIAVNSPIKNLSRKGPPLPEDGLSVNISATGVSLKPVDGLPVIKDAELRARVTGRSATVTLPSANMDSGPGRKVNLADVVFEVPDMVPKPSPAKVRFRVEAPVPAIADILASDRLSGATDTLDPAAVKGNVVAQVSMALPIQRELTKQDTIYSVTADVTNFSADKLVMNQKVEASSIKVVANNQAYQVRGDVKINGQSATIDYRKPTEGDADIRLQATVDDAGRSRLGIDLGSAVVGPMGVKLAGKLSGADRDNKFAVELDLAQTKLDNLLPGWAKQPGRPARAALNLTTKPQSYRIDDLVIEGSGTSVKGSLEVDQNGDLISVNFPTYTPSEGDKTTLRADRSNDGVLRVVMRGDVFDGRSFLKSAVSGRDADTKSKAKNFDFDIDLKVGAVAGYFGEAVRSVDLKMSRRNGSIRTFALTSKLGRDTPLTGELRGRTPGQGREVILIETKDAGSFFRFTDTYGKMVGGQLSLAMEPPAADTRPKEGLLNIRNFAIKGESKLDTVAPASSGAAGGGVAFSRLRAEFTRHNGQLSIRDGVVKGPSVGATIEGTIDYPNNRVRMSGTFVPMYGLNNLFGQIPLLGLVLGGGSNEGLIGVTYEVVGSPGQPDLRINPISAMAPGVLRKIFEFGTGRQNNTPEFPNSTN